MPDRDSSLAQQMWMKGSNHSHGFSCALNPIVLRPMSRELWWCDQRVSVDAKLTRQDMTRSTTLVIGWSPIARRMRVGVVPIALRSPGHRTHPLQNPIGGAS
jgi:hypothetical protein